MHALCTRHELISKVKLTTMRISEIDICMNAIFAWKRDWNMLVDNRLYWNLKSPLPWRRNLLSLFFFNSWHLNNSLSVLLEREKVITRWQLKSQKTQKQCILWSVPSFSYDLHFQFFSHGYQLLNLFFFSQRMSKFACRKNLCLDNKARLLQDEETREFCAFWGL